MRLSRALLSAPLLALAASSLPVPAAAANPQVEIKTSMGSMTVELYADKAPKTVDNFVQYVKSGFYGGTIFHRVIPGFMIQGGGFAKDMSQKPTRPPIAHEGSKCGDNSLGTIAMARTGDPNSASAQFFINVVNNERLNHRDTTPAGWGYCGFGKVTKGLDVAQKIVGVPTGSVGPYQNVPKDAITIESITVVAN